LDPSFPLVHSFGHDLELAVLEEERNYGSVHVASLLICLFSNEFVDVFRGVTLLLKELGQSLNIPSKIISFQDNITLSLFH